MPSRAFFAEGVITHIMQVSCGQCGMRYEFDAAEIPADGYDAQCSHCNNVFFVAPEAPATLAADDFALTQNDAHAGLQVSVQVSIACPQCGALYQFDSLDVPEAGYDAQCTQCESVFLVAPHTVMPYEGAAVPAAEPALDDETSFASVNELLGQADAPAPQPPVEPAPRTARKIADDEAERTRVTPAPAPADNEATKVGFSPQLLDGGTFDRTDPYMRVPEGYAGHRPSAGTDTVISARQIKDTADDAGGDTVVAPAEEHTRTHVTVNPYHEETRNTVISAAPGAPEPPVEEVAELPPQPAQPAAAPIGHGAGPERYDAGPEHYDAGPDPHEAVPERYDASEHEHAGPGEPYEPAPEADAPAGRDAYHDEAAPLPRVNAWTSAAEQAERLTAEATNPALVIPGPGVLSGDRRLPTGTLPPDDAGESHRLRTAPMEDAAAARRARRKQGSADAQPPGRMLRIVVMILVVLLGGLYFVVQKQPDLVARILGGGKQQHAVSSEAAALFDQGRKALLRDTDADYETAIETFGKALQQDAQYAEAQAWQVVGHSMRGADLRHEGARMYAEWEQEQALWRGLKALERQGTALSPDQTSQSQQLEEQGPKHLQAATDTLERGGKELSVAQVQAQRARTLLPRSAPVAAAAALCYTETPNDMAVARSLLGQYSGLAAADSEAAPGKADAAPADVWLLMAQGRVAATQEKTRDDARAAFNKALEIDPTLVRARWELAQLDIQAGAPADAKKRYQEILAAVPNHPKAVAALAALDRPAAAPAAAPDAAAPAPAAEAPAPDLDAAAPASPDDNPNAETPPTRRLRHRRRPAPPPAAAPAEPSLDAPAPAAPENEKE